MRPTKAQREWAKVTLEKWRPRLFLGEWFIELDYAKAGLQVNDESEASATCFADPVYMHAKITIYPCFWKQPKDRWEHVMVHELAHCQTQSVWNVIRAQHAGELITPENARCEIEQLTQRITNMVYQQEWK